jgi:Protein of unknown function (DUF2480)
MSDAIVNKVAESGLITLDLEKFLPEDPIVLFDLKEYLFMGLILKEKDFRAAMQQHDWLQYQGKYVAVACTADAVIPVWAYMLVASYLQPFASDVVYGTEEDLKNQVMMKNLQQLDVSIYADKRIVVKGCGDVPISDRAYLEVTKRLRPVAKSIMYGEPCSTVPIFKKK